ncbi:MAG: TolC family protein [Balneolaceae bacterium]
MNKRIFIPLLLLFILAPLTHLFAQYERQLTLEESISIAKDNSPLARAAKYALVASKWRYKSFRADLLPSLVANGDVPNYSFGQRTITTKDGIEFIDLHQSDANLRLSINQSILPTGGSLSLSSGLSRLGIFQGEDNYGWQSTPIEIGLTQPLFQFNSLKWRNRTEPLRYKIAQKRFVEDLEEVAFTVTQRFFDVLLAKINIEVSEFNVAVNDSIYNISKGRYQVGNIAENELLQSELGLRNAEASLTTARLSYQRVVESFKGLLGIPDEETVVIISPDTAPDVQIDIEKAQELAQANNSTSLQFQLSEIQANQEYERARKESGFSANLQASYGLNQISEDFDKLYENPQNRQFFTVGFQIPIFNWGKQMAEIKSARNLQQETANTIAYQRLQFELDVRSTVREFGLLKQQVEIAAISNDIGDRRYDVSKNRYLIGKIDITNLFIAQNEKDSAQRNYIQALRNYWTGYYNLRRLTLYDFELDAPITYDIEY